MNPSASSPFAIVVSDPSAASAAMSIAQLAGIAAATPDSLPATPWDLSGTRLIVSVHSASGREEVSQRLLLRRVNVVAVVPKPLDADAASARYLDGLGRHARVLDWRDNPTAALTDEQVRLLGHLALGRSIGDAARSTQLSERSAHRRIADARSVLGVRSTTAACRSLSEAVATLRSAQPDRS